MPFLAMALAVVAGLVLSWLVRQVVLRLNRSKPELRETSRVARLPLRLSLCLIAVRIALATSRGDLEWRRGLDHLLLIALIGSLAWLAIAMLLIIEAMVLTRYRVDVADNRRARRLRTQVILARRIGVALIAVVALGSMMLTFPAIQALGAGLLASAGVISIVAGLAAQTSLVNVFAGIQLAFTDAIRVDDVVVVQKEWGRIEEITLTYVVVHIWDDRRLILPSTYFTTTPFENWTRRQSEVMGTVEFDLDWRAPVEAMRGELKKVLADTAAVGQAGGDPADHGRHRRLCPRTHPGQRRGQRLPLRPPLPDPRGTGAVPAAGPPDGAPPRPPRIAAVGRWSRPRRRRFRRRYGVPSDPARLPPRPSTTGTRIPTTPSCSPDPSRRSSAPRPSPDRARTSSRTATTPSPRRTSRGRAAAPGQHDSTAGPGRSSQPPSTGQ